MARSIYERLNRHISEFHCVLIEQVDGNVYLLKEHWKYLKPKIQAERILLGKGRISSKQYEYLTHEFPCFKRQSKPNQTYEGKTHKL